MGCLLEEISLIGLPLVCLLLFRPIGGMLLQLAFFGVGAVGEADALFCFGASLELWFGLLGTRLLLRLSGVVLLYCSGQLAEGAVSLDPCTDDLFLAVFPSLLDESRPGAESGIFLLDLLVTSSFILPLRVLGLLVLLLLLLS